MRDMAYPDNPFTLFQTWFDEASAQEINDPNAMSLATVDERGAPSVRIVLLKNISADGFTFFTNLESRKGVELAQNKNVALCFHWKTLQRQIRVEGLAVPVSEAVADAYFANRPVGSQIGAWASQQSRPVESRDVLEQELARYALKFGDEPVARPPHWSGFCVQPHAIEFWQERPFRLHDRMVYHRVGGDTWQQVRLYP